MIILRRKKYCEGQAMLTAVIFFLFISLVVILSLVVSAVSGSRTSQDLLDSKKSYFLSEAGAEDVAYRISKGRIYDSTEVLALDGYLTTTTVINVGNYQEVNSSGDVNADIRKVRIRLTSGSQASFNYGLQVGNGGLVMENSSSVVGNVYSNGPIQGAGSNLIRGDVVSAQLSGAISRIHATSSAYAHSISNSTIDKDAYYVNISSTSVGGTLYPNSPDQPGREMPISDDTINSWEQAATTTVISSPCPYIINSDTAIGPAKITCDLIIQGNRTVTLTGPLWVTGNITAQNNAIIRLDPSLGRKSIAIIADNLSNRLTSGEISLQNSVTFVNSGTEGSYILFISRNNSAESGGSEMAIAIQQSASGDVLLYAPHGEISLQNSVNLREVTAYKIHLQNSAQVAYESGLASLLFQSGPSGGYSIISWRELK